MNFKRLSAEFIGLQTPRARIIMLSFVTIMVFFAPYHWLGNLSLWKALGWQTAPSIGLTRSYHLLLHGDFSAAWHRNALIYPCVLVFGTIFVSDMLTFRKTRRQGFGQ